VIINDLPPGAERPLFDSTVTGNLRGNINNGGFVVEGDAVTYVATIDGIYYFKYNVTTGRKLIADVWVRALNYHQGKLYYAGGEQGLFCVDPESGDITKLCEVSVFDIFFDEGILYFVNGDDYFKLYTIDLDGSNMRKLNDTTAIYYRNIVGEYQYYTNPNDKNTVYRENLSTGESEQLYPVTSAFVSVYDTTIYFCDWSIVGGLFRMDLDGGNMVKLIGHTYSYLIATPVGIFAINLDEQLEFISLDGKTRNLLTYKRCGEFCVTQNWIIYTNHDDNENLWAMRLDGSEDHQLNFF
jgi:hypothetical protein